MALKFGVFAPKTKKKEFKARMNYNTMMHHCDETVIGCMYVYMF